MDLKRELEGIDVFSIASGAMISSGLFVLPAIAYKVGGSSILLAYFIAGLMMLPALLSQLELSSAIPKAGGTYFFTERILGTAAGVVAGFANWFSISLKSAFSLVGIGVFASLFVPNITDWQIKLIALAACAVFTAFNLISVKSSSKLENLLVFFLLAILVQFFILGYRVVDFTRIQSIFKTDFHTLLSVTGMVFISYGGLTNIAAISGEVKNPQKNVVAGGIAAFVIVQILYLTTILIVIGVLPPDMLIHSHMPIADTAYQFAPGTPMGITQKILASAAALLAFITTANAGIMTASRQPMAMSFDGLLPKSFSKISAKNKTPYVSILFTSGFMAVIILLLNIEDLAKVASLFLCLLFVLINISVIVIRQSKMETYKPSFKTPLYPFMQIAGIIMYLVVIVQMGFTIIAIACSFIVLSLLWYVFYARRKVNRKSALVHMIENITAPELIENETEIELENELLNILIEGNEIVEDRFDGIVRKASVIDMKKASNRSEVFRLLSKEIADLYDLNKLMVEIKLHEREEYSSTLLTPGKDCSYAIPHIIIDGEGMFDMILVRNCNGIKWTEKGDVVSTVFCLVGTKDERNFHLRALMAIAQILQDPKFNDEWMNAQGAKELKTTLLLSKRQRMGDGK